MLRLHRIVTQAARVVALIGGAVLLTLVLITCASIIGRSVNAALNSDLVTGLVPGLAGALLSTGIGAIPGDFELVEAGMAFCIFAFLPLCQVTAGHATVGLFTDALPSGLRRWLIFATETLFAVVLVIIAVQLDAALERAMRTGQTTFLLQFPVWWSYLASFTAACAAAAAGVYMAGLRLFEALSGRTVAPQGGAAPPDAPEGGP